MLTNYLFGGYNFISIIVQVFVCVCVCVCFATGAALKETTQESTMKRLC